MKLILNILSMTFLGLFLSFTAVGAKKKTTSFSGPDTTQIRELNYRCIGPFRGGRSAAVTGVKGNPRLFYMGATGGGVSKSTNSGNSWENISKKVGRCCICSLAGDLVSVVIFYPNLHLSACTYIRVCKSLLHFLHICMFINTCTVTWIQVE